MTEHAREDVRTVRLALDQAASHLSLLADDESGHWPWRTGEAGKTVLSLLREAEGHVAEAKRALLKAESVRSESWNRLAGFGQDRDPSPEG